MTTEQVLKFIAVGKILQNCDANTVEKLHKDYTVTQELGDIDYLLRKYADTNPGLGTWVLPVQQTSNTIPSTLRQHVLLGPCLEAETQMITKREVVLD